MIDIWCLDSIGNFNNSSIFSQFSFISIKLNYSNDLKSKIWWCCVCCLSISITILRTESWCWTEESPLAVCVESALNSRNVVPKLSLLKVLWVLFWFSYLPYPYRQPVIYSLPVLFQSPWKYDWRYTSAVPWLVVEVIFPIARCDHINNSTSYLARPFTKFHFLHT